MIRLHDVMSLKTTQFGNIQIVSNFMGLLQFVDLSTI